MKKEQTGKRKENNNIRKKYVYTKPKFNRIVKLTKKKKKKKKKNAKGQQKDNRTNTFVK